MHDNIVIRDYDPEWPKRAVDEIRSLKAVFDASRFPVVEHIGSTSIPGMPAKPIIDILISCTDLKYVKEYYEVLSRLGYELQVQYEKNDHLFFVKRNEAQKRTHHLHFYPVGHQQISDHIKFRDILRRDKNLAGEYGRLKCELAKKHNNDMDVYTENKTEFVNKVLSL